AHVVAIQRDVQGAARYFVTGNLLERFRDAPGQRHAARADADEDHFFNTGIAFEDFVRDSREGASHAARIEDNSHAFTSLRPRRAALKSGGDYSRMLSTQRAAAREDNR